MKTAIATKKSIRRGRPALTLKFPTVGKKFTMRELEAKSGMSYAGILSRVKQAQAAKAIEVVGHYDTGSAGRPTQVFEVKKDVAEAVAKIAKIAKINTTPHPSRPKFRPLESN